MPVVYSSFSRKAGIRSPRAHAVAGPPPSRGDDNSLETLAAFRSASEHVGGGRNRLPPVLRSLRIPATFAAEWAECRPCVRGRGAAHRHEPLADLVDESWIEVPPADAIDSLHRAGIRCHLAAIKCGHHFASFDRCKAEQICATCCVHRDSPGSSGKPFWQLDFLRPPAPMHLPRLRNPG
jgi:hypothetical protein